MLTRLNFQRHVRLLLRGLSDKTSDTDDKSLTNHENTSAQADDTNKDLSSEDKIQLLLKRMMAEQTISDDEYRLKFTVAPERQKKPKPIDKFRMDKIENNITKAANEVAHVIGGDVKKTETELLSKVLGKINQTSTSLSDLLIGMKVDRTRESEDLDRKENRGDRVKRMVTKSRAERTQNVSVMKQKTRIHMREKEKQGKLHTQTIDIFSEQPLGIFTKIKQPNYGTQLDMWNKLNQREIVLATTQPPANYLQKMILWTEQGKVWKFPINNEQGMEEELNVDFSEHIFLDNHLEDWCPKKGPVRHFMELVCVGLSKNAFYTAQEKKDHIMWYKEYFDSKKDLLTEVGAWEVPPKTSESTESSKP